MPSACKRSKTNTSILGSNQASLTVCFNVGGKRYEVSRSLLDQHKSSMLSRLASDVWMQCTSETNNENGLFIERDGERFAYVLDYMRDGLVILPWSVPKDMLKQDLEYFNLGYSDSTIYHQDSTDAFFFSGAAARLVAAERVRDHLVMANKKLKATDQAITALQHQRFCQEIAMKTYEKYAGGEDSRYDERDDRIILVNDCEIPFSALLDHDAKDFVVPLNNALESYGLECTALSFLPSSSTDSSYTTYHHLKSFGERSGDCLSGTISVAVMCLQVTVSPCTFKSS